MNPYQRKVCLPIAFALLVLLPAVSRADGEVNAPPAWISSYITRLEGRIAEADRNIRKTEETIRKTRGVLDRARREKNEKAQVICEKAIETSYAAQQKYEKSKRLAMLNIGSLKRLADAWGSSRGQRAATVYQSGKVEIKRQGQEGWNDLGNGKNLFLREGDRVRTGSDGRAMFRMEDGSIVNLDRNSTVDIEGPDRLALTLGIMKMQIKERLGKLKVHTPCGVIAVRGTELSISHDDAKGTEVVVLEGSVEVRGLSGGDGVILNAGQMATVATGGVPSEPRPFDPAKVVRWWEEED